MRGEVVGRCFLWFGAAEECCDPAGVDGLGGGVVPRGSPRRNGVDPGLIALTATRLERTSAWADRTAVWGGFAPYGPSG